MIGLSFSRLKDAECPFRFRALHIDKTHKEPVTAAMRVGGEVAKIIEHYRRHCLETGVTFDHQWIMARIDALGPIDELGDDDISRIKKLLQAFRWSSYSELPPKEFMQWVGVEERIAFGAGLRPLRQLKDGEDPWYGDVADVHFRIVQDFAYLTSDGTYYIIDDKTGRAKPDPLQVKIYAYLGPRSLPEGMKADRVVCIFNELGRGEETLAGEFDLSDMSWQEEMHEFIVSKVEEVNSWADYPAIPCSRCGWCTVPGCPHREDTEAAIEAALPIEAPKIPTEIVSREQAEKALAFLGFAEEITTKVKDLLHEWVEQNGPVEYAGKVAQMDDVERWQPKDLVAVIKALRKFGASTETIYSHLSLTDSALQKICKKSGILDAYEMVRAMGIVKPSKRFAIKKSKTF